jgi:hypothetical protein
MVIFSVSFLVISYVLTNIFGPVGFILANCVNMLARIIHSLIYINKKYKSTSYKPLEGLVPDRKFIAILVISGVATKLSENVQFVACAAHIDWCSIFCCDAGSVGGGKQIAPEVGVMINTDACQQRMINFI